MLPCASPFPSSTSSDGSGDEPDEALAFVSFRAFVQVLTEDDANGPGTGEEADWLVACRQLSVRVERTGADDVILDLGLCTASEAETAVRGLLAHVGMLGLQARAGIGSSSCLAQLACRNAQAQRPIVLITPDQSQAFVRRIPVCALVGLHPQGLISPEVVERLERYGLRTLGHLARIGELTLRRQFGAAGSLLAALAQGQDAQPFNPTPAPSMLRFHARFAAPADPDAVLALLPHLAERIADQLRLQGRTAHSLRLDIRWEDGRVERRRLTLRQYADQSALLDQGLRRLLVPLLALSGDDAESAGDAHRSMPSYMLGVRRAPLQNGNGEDPADQIEDRVEDRIEDRIEELRVALSDFAPLTPAQATFWRTRQQQMAAIADVAETAARRHGRELLLRPQVVAPDAVFTEDRYALRPPADACDDSPPLPSTGTEHTAGGRRLSRSSATDAAAGADAWSGVPQRLHWW